MARLAWAVPEVLWFQEAYSNLLADFRLLRAYGVSNKALSAATQLSPELYVVQVRHTPGRAGNVYYSKTLDSSQPDRSFYKCRIMRLRPA